MIRDLKTMEDWQALLAGSHERPTFLFKHSTSCSISASRWRVFQDYVEGDQSADYWKVLVIQDRSLSRQIAAECGVRHQSPQAILFHKGRAVWDASHYSITEAAMSSALAQSAPS